MTLRRRAMTGAATSLALAATALMLVMVAPAAPARADTAHAVNPANAGGAVPVAATPTAGGSGLWIASTDGAVAPEGDAPSLGDASSLALNAPIVSVARSGPTNLGYWLMGADGGIFSFGDAQFYGSTGSLTLNQPALQLVATPDGGGYWIVARDGGVFAFGDAQFYGSTGSLTLVKPVVGMAATPDGGGYWLVASDGGVFAFGDARFYGSMGGKALNRRVVGMAATPGGGGGYWLVASDGGVFAFGDARYLGSDVGATGGLPVLALVPSQGDGTGNSSQGYWQLLANGTVANFGTARALSIAPVPDEGYSLAGRLVTIDPGHNGGNAADPAYINQLVNAGGFLKACNTTGTATDAGYTEAAFNFDMATRLAADLRRLGATVVLTRTSNTGVGPCINQRAAIDNQERSDAALAIHADGAPASGRGFSVDEPELDPGYNDGIQIPSRALGTAVISAFAAGTPMPISDYTGVDGAVPRNDLGELNLAHVPIVLIECGNMRNATDAGLQVSPTFRQEAAGALAQGLANYLLSQ